MVVGRYNPRDAHKNGLGEVLGRRAEMRVTETLKLLAATYGITKIDHMQQNSTLDRRGIDLLIHRRGCRVMPLQVKSKSRAVGRFKRKHPKIPVVVAGEKIPLEAIINQLQEIMENWK